MTDGFSKHNPSLRLAWDSSSLKAFQFCPRSYKYQYLDGWQSPSVDLAFGRYIADGLETFKKLRLDGLSVEDALVQTVRQTLEATWFEPMSCSLGAGCDEAGVCYAAAHDQPEHCGRQATQWGGRYETMWKCEGVKPYKNQKGNRAVCPFAFKHAWFPGDPPDVCGSCGSPIIVERQYIPDDTKKNRITLIRALIWYGLEQPEDISEMYRPFVFPDGTKAVELSGRLPLPFKNRYGEQYLVTWHFDDIGVWGDELFITDNKTTTKTLNEKFFETYSPDTQFDTYDLVGSVMFPALNLRGTMVEGIQVMVGGVAFGKHPYYKTDAQRDEHLNDLEFWLRQAEEYAVGGYWPMNKRSCWLCPFKRVCSQDPSVREGYLASNFTKGDRWEPLKER